MARSFEIFWPRTPEGMSEAEWQARLQLAACYCLVDHYGWTSVVYNHITLRIPGTDHFLINPFGVRYDELRASDLIRIDIDSSYGFPESTCLSRDRRRVSIWPYL